MLCLVACACLWHATRLLPQDAAQPDASESNGKVRLEYCGTEGLRRTAPQEISTLESVYVSYGTKITADDIAFLATLANAKDLHMGGNLSDEYVSIEGSLAPLSKMKNLQNVALCKKDVCDEDLAFVAGLPAIESLELVCDTNPYGEDGPSVTDDCALHLSKATTLRNLDIIRGDKLTDQFVCLIARELKSLESLRMQSDFLTDKSLQILADKCPNLRWLDLHSDHFTDKGVGHLAIAKKMEMLWLSSKSLTCDCVSAVSGLVHLRDLGLTVPTIDDDGVKTIAERPCLEVLALRQPALSDNQFAMFSHHPTLRSAYLNGHDLSTTKVLQVIQTIPKLNHLEVGENKSLQSAVNRFLAKRKATD